ncbi:hypothetical protein CEXT_208551 [Caerostris extrusa]|uniref:Uncharacterized protein n=1 Tax=Caerostris extrusa TaxID=172846 RepID=A0AAV4XII4_CAEEX|nr:hypothetical protein CEXT_208551 [Caerostris extrusa]
MGYTLISVHHGLPDEPGNEYSCKSDGSWVIAHWGKSMAARFVYMKFLNRFHEKQFVIPRNKIETYVRWLMGIGLLAIHGAGWCRNPQPVTDQWRERAPCDVTPGDRFHERIRAVTDGSLRLPSVSLAIRTSLSKLIEIDILRIEIIMQRNTRFVLVIEMASRGMRGRTAFTARIPLPFKDIGLATETAGSRPNKGTM